MQTSRHKQWDELSVQTYTTNPIRTFPSTDPSSDDLRRGIRPSNETDAITNGRTLRVVYCSCDRFVGAWQFTSAGFVCSLREVVQ